MMYFPLSLTISAWSLETETCGRIISQLSSLPIDTELFPESGSVLHQFTETAEENTEETPAQEEKPVEEAAEELLQLMEKLEP